MKPKVDLQKLFPVAPPLESDLPIPVILNGNFAQGFQIRNQRRAHNFKTTAVQSNNVQSSIAHFSGHHVFRYNESSFNRQDIKVSEGLKMVSIIVAMSGKFWVESANQRGDALCGIREGVTAPAEKQKA